MNRLGATLGPHTFVGGLRAQAPLFIIHCIDTIDRDGASDLRCPSGKQSQLHRKSALKELVRVFFNGSPAGAATALLGMSEPIDETELEALESLLARARAARREGADG